MSDHKKRIVRWEFPEAGWVFSHCDKFSIVPSLKLKGYFELWEGDKFISNRKTIPLCKQDADEYEVSK
jgi:hypothetical protein